MWKKITPLPVEQVKIRNKKQLRFAENAAALTKPLGYIFSQNAADVKALRFGRFGKVGPNGCGSVAVYNALKALGKPRPYAEIIYEMERNHMLSMFGAFGASPLRFPRIFAEHGVDCTVIRSWDELCRRADEFRVMVIYMQYKKKLMRHYFCIVKQADGRFFTLNRSNPNGFGKIDLSQPFDHVMLKAFCLKNAGEA